jgi:hypothetical protein
MVTTVSKTTDGLADLVNAAKSGQNIGVPSFVGKSVAADVEKNPSPHKKVKKNKDKDKDDVGKHWKLQKRKKAICCWLAIGLLVLALMILGGYFFLKDKNDKDICTDT